MAVSLEEKKKKLSEKKQDLLLKEKIIREKEKRQRFEKFSSVGELAYNANIDHLDHSILLGAFLEIAQIANKANEEKWQRNAEEFMKKQEAKIATPVSIRFLEEPTKEAKEKLKGMSLKWNSFRKEFYGYGNKKEIEESLIGLKFQVEEISE
jgi:hypothetical protein